MGNYAGEAEVAACVYAQHLCLLGAAWIAILSANIEPLQPESPAVGEHIGMRYLDFARLSPVGAPPGGAVEAAKVPLPVWGKMFREASVELMGEARANYANLTIWL